MEGYYASEHRSNKPLILLSFLVEAEGPIPSATINATRDSFADAGGPLWRILHPPLTFMPALPAPAGLPGRCFRFAPWCLIDVAAAEQAIARICSLEPLPKLDMVAVGVADLRP